MGVTSPNPALPRVPRLQTPPSGRAPVPPCVPWLWTCLPAREVSSVALCPVALDPTSLLERAPALPRVPWLWILPPSSGGLQRYHVSRGSGSYLPAQEGLALPRVP
jgi:hypothetical protein